MNQWAIGYIRVSTAGQATDGVSIDAQTTRIRAWCDANGHGLADAFTDARWMRPVSAAVIFTVGGI